MLSSADGAKMAFDNFGELVTVTPTDADFVVAPTLSTAVAVTVYVPGVLTLQVAVYGAVASDPIRVEPA